MAKNNKKVLIVEDDEDFLSILEKVLVSEGFSVVKAQDGESGAGAAEKEKPDLIVSDVLMPRLDGKAMAKKIKEAGVQAPVIFLTNVENQDPENKEFDYLIKTKFHIGEIVKKIKEKLGV